MGEQDEVIGVTNNGVRFAGEFFAARDNVVTDVANQKQHGNAEACEHRPFVGCLAAAFDQNETDDKQDRRQRV